MFILMRAAAAGIARARLATNATNANIQAFGFIAILPYLLERRTPGEL
jgi:hypothetical protein